MKIRIVLLRRPISEILRANRDTHWLLLLRHFGVEQSNLKFEAPRRSTWRMDRVPVKLHRPVDWLWSESSNLTNSTAERENPNAASSCVVPARSIACALGVPVRGNNRPTGQIIAFI